MLFSPRARTRPTTPRRTGAIKVAPEHAVRDVVGDRALAVRAGLICGRDDLSDRFGYWPNRFSRGGPAVVPDALDQPAQIVDVLDLADWIVRCGEERLGGTFDAGGPRSTLGAVLDEIADAVGAPDLHRVPVAPDELAAAGVTPWAGPRSLPLWLPASHVGMTARDTTAAAAAGLRCRPVADTARAALEHERALGLRRAGLTPAEEADLLRVTRWRSAPGACPRRRRRPRPAAASPRRPPSPGNAARSRRR
jgi:2'-hydroxyisoflavone reductase